MPRVESGMDYENGQTKQQAFLDIKAGLVAIDDVNPQAVSDALAPAVPEILSVLIQRALGTFVGQRVARTGETVNYKLDPDAKAAQIVLERVLGKVPEELNVNQKTMNKYLLALAGHGAIEVTSVQVDQDGQALLTDDTPPS